MLSRVAAVKAPRTHNRRRVTGSSGRRRKGRESEPQRSNMSRRVFTSAVLLIVVMMCCSSGTVTAQANEPTSDPNYKWKDVKDEDGGVTVESLGVPGLLKVGSDVFAVAEAQCKKNGESDIFTGIASQIITKDKADKPMEVSNGAEDKAQVLEKYHSAAVKKVDVSRPTTVMQGNDIYMLVGKYSPTAADENRGAGDGGFLLLKGEVSADESGGGKRIKWKYTTDVPRASFGELDSWTGFIGGGGSGIETKDRTLLFPVQGTKKKGEAQNDEKAVSLLIYTLKDTKSWTLSKEVPDGGCSDPSVVEWGEDKKLMMMTACDDGRRRVYESGDKGDSWTEALGTLSRVWGNKKGEEVKAVRSGFITATIDGVEGNRNVMLVTLPVYSKEDSKKVTGNGKGELHLWLTDNTHIVDIGSVSGDDDVAASSLLYKSAGSGDKKDELIVLYEKKKEDGKLSHSLWSVLLTGQLQRVKDVLATWKKVDDRVSKMCPSESDVESTLPENDCSPTDKITDGLVGFLSENFSDGTWRDEYLGVNATVHKGTEVTEATGAAKAEDGVTFQGAWAEWPVGRQGENQLYHFANYNFTLVATVSIDGVPQEDNPIPLMGAEMNDDENTENSVLLGLSYENGGKWKLLCGSENPEDQSVTLEETKHHIVILLRNGTQGSAYVDGQPVSGDAQCDLKNTKDKKISHFYIGGDGGAKADSEVQDVSVTVTNVLLYNRPLNDDEISALNAKLSISKAKDTKTVKKGTPPPEAIKPATLETGTPSSLGGQQQTEQELLRKSENAGSGGLSTSAASTATTFPAAKESDNQSASGTPPEGHSNVDVDSSS
ncbi:putative trans-sialidase, partial [Trypanosoma cruzi]